MLVVEAPKAVSNEEKFRIPKLALPVKCKSDANASNVDECDRIEQISNIQVGNG